MFFQIGEKVVYPNYGVGVIENVGSRFFGSQYEKFYLFRLMCRDLTVMVPVAHACDLHLRKVTRSGEIARVLSYLSAGRCFSSGDYRDRFRENSEKMQSGGLQATAEVLKSLLMLQLTKTLCYREKNMLDRARNMSITEMAVSLCIPEVAAADMLHKALLKASLA